MKFRSTAALALAIAPLTMALAPASAAPAPAPLTSLATNDNGNDRDVFVKKAPKTATSSIEIFRTTYAQKNAGTADARLVVNMRVKSVLPNSSKFQQNFGVIGASKDGTQGFVLFYKPGKGASTLVTTDPKPASCRDLKVSHRKISINRAAISFSVPTSCIATAKPVKLSSDAILTKDGVADQNFAQDVSPRTRLVTFS